MKTIALWCAELRILLGGNCFLHVARQDDALFITDYPARVPGAPAYESVLQSGFVVTGLPGLWLIDAAPQRYAAWAAALPEVALPPMTDANLPLWSLAFRLLSSSTPPQQQPLHLLRAGLKCLETDAEQLPDRLLPLLADAQRQGIPLPTALGAYIALHLKEDVT